MYTVVISSRAQSNLRSIFRYIAKSSSSRIAESYVEALRDECRTLTTFPKRGTDRKAIFAGLRTTGFRRSATIAFRVSKNTVTIVSIHYRGMNVLPRLGSSGQQN